MQVLLPLQLLDPSEDLEIDEPHLRPVPQGISHYSTMFKQVVADLDSGTYADSSMSNSPRDGGLDHSSDAGMDLVESGLQGLS